MALVNYDNSDNELSDSAEESTDDIVTETGVDKVEPEYKMRMPKSAARTVNPATVVPALVTSKTKTGKVLLSVPALQEASGPTVLFINWSVVAKPLSSVILNRLRQCRIDPAVLSELDVPKKEVPPDGDEAIGDVQCWTEHTFVPGPERKRARLNQPGTRSIPVHDLLATSNQSIREVNQADLTVGADLELMKSVTADESQYRSHRASEDDDPGKLAHRKHQITWLAYQASFFSSSCFAS
ncbi:hypothetical protein X801_07780 [Opisthorchis viverrini]|uniref:Uncharacterized protein n=1 Tax=Opisthorchis viverrini TaxID=6198 RepID=A0A1S8WPI9_OPIVI|nr:hypothetical protein X801_07780 [Opisthorchis viverrini]